MFFDAKTGSENDYDDDSQYENYYSSDGEQEYTILDKLDNRYNNQESEDSLSSIPRSGTNEASSAVCDCCCENLGFFNSYPMQLCDFICEKFHPRVNQQLLNQLKDYQI